MVFHWGLSDNKSPQVFRTCLRILAVLSNAVIWMVSTRPSTSKSSRPFNNPLVIVPNAPITSGTIVTFMFHSFSNSQARSRYLSFFSLSFRFIQWYAGTAKSTILQILFFFFLFFFFLFFFFLFLIIMRSGLLAGIRWSVCLSILFYLFIFVFGFFFSRVLFGTYFHAYIKIWVLIVYLDVCFVLGRWLSLFLYSRQRIHVLSSCFQLVVSFRLSRLFLVCFS